jgi:hypothetical protein
MAIADLKVFSRVGETRPSGIYTTITSSHAARAPGATISTITVADGSRIPRGTGDSEDCYLSVLQSTYPYRTVDILHGYTLSGNTISNAVSDYGDAFSSGYYLFVGTPAEWYADLITELETMEADIAAGGYQTQPDVIIDAAGGGDYLTMSAAVAAEGASKWYYVKKGAYSEPAAYTPPANSRITYEDTCTVNLPDGERQIFSTATARVEGRVKFVGKGTATRGVLFTVTNSDCSNLYTQVLCGATGLTISDTTLRFVTIGANAKFGTVEFLPQTVNCNNLSTYGAFVDPGAAVGKIRSSGFIATTPLAGSSSIIGFDNSTGCRISYEVDATNTGWPGTASGTAATSLHTGYALSGGTPFNVGGATSFVRVA